MQAVQETNMLHTMNIPKELISLDQWVLWKSDPKRGKVPYTHKGLMADITDPNRLFSFQGALKEFHQGGFDGIGFVFNDNDPFTGIDLDNCFKDGKLSRNAATIIKSLNSYTEKSPSGSGVHIIVKAKMPGSRNRRKGFEMYDKNRFFTVTGDHLSSSPGTIEERQSEINKLYKALFDSQDESSVAVVVTQKSPAMDDDELMNVILKAKNGERFKKLYTGNIDGYESQSEADQAFCSMLAFYTQDTKQIDRMYRNSGLMRDKWNRPDYSRSTINKAVNGTKNRYKVIDQSSAYDDFKDSIPQKQVYEPYEGHKFIAPGAFPLTELGNAERVVHLHKDEIKYSPERGWLLWDGTRWVEDSSNHIEIIVARTLRGIYHEAFRTKDEDLKEATLKWARRCESRNIRINTVADVRPHVSVSNDELDTGAYMINVNNGIVDLETGKLLDHDPAHLITKLAPVDYDPQATAPRWRRFLEEVFITDDGKADLEVIHFMQKAIGYSLSGSIEEEVIFFLTGSGGNGKSKFLEAIQNMLGDYAKQTNANTFIKKQNDNSINNDIARLDKARFVSAIESEQGQQLAESLVKQLTGGDKIAARFLRKEFFEFRPEFKIFFSTNHKPIIRGTDDGIWRRIRLIPFNARFEGENRDTRLSEKLEKEAAGIFNWAVEGFKLWKKEGLKPPKSIDVATQAYRDDMDILKPFIEECCIIHKNAKIEGKILFEAYQTYCFSSGEVAIRGNRTFYRILRTQGYELLPGTDNKKFIHGLSLKSEFKTHYDFLE